MTGLVSGGHLGEGTNKVAKRYSTVDNAELERRVLCMGFRCFFAAQSLVKRSKAFISFFRGESNVCGFASNTRFGGTGRR